MHVCVSVYVCALIDATSIYKSFVSRFEQSVSRQLGLQTEPKVANRERERVRERERERERAHCG